VVLRPSGTEPVIRVMAEGEDEDEITQVVDRIAAAISASDSVA
jgi:phosphoglucosamine mutase